ncbi:HEAT repeat domain-containing protein [Candidatus Woesearchaeota archaeon]|nr:HEAT repeat domain-containing protein [Candidatus Woesearchaeota archaeon]
MITSTVDKRRHCAVGKFEFWCVLIMGVFVITGFLPAESGADAQKIAHEILSKVPLGDDFMDEKDIKRWDDLAARGAELLPGIIYIFEHPNPSELATRIYGPNFFDEKSNWIILSRVAGTIGRMKPEIDRSPLLPSIRKLLTREDDATKKWAIGSLGSNGNIEDSPYILPFLEHKNMSMRVTAVYALGNIGDDKTAQEIENISEKRMQGLNTDDIKKDYSFAHSYIAILTLKYKTIKAKAEKEQDAKTKVALTREWQDTEAKYKQIFLDKASHHWLTAEFVSPYNELAKKVTAHLLKQVLPADIKSETNPKNKEILQRILKEASSYDDKIVLIEDKKEPSEPREKDSSDKPKDNASRQGDDAKKQPPEKK